MGFWRSVGNATVRVAKAVFEVLKNEQEKYDTAEEYYEERVDDDWDKDRFAREYKRYKDNPYKRTAIVKKYEEKYGDNTED